jgi:hypothetical protein
MTNSKKRDFVTLQTSGDSEHPMDAMGTVVGGFANYLSTLFDSTSTLFFQFNDGEA